MVYKKNKTEIKGVKTGVHIWASQFFSRHVQMVFFCLLDRASSYYLNKMNQLDVTLLKFFITQHVSNVITFILRSWRLYVGVLLCFGVYWCIGAVRLE